MSEYLMAKMTHSASHGAQRVMWNFDGVCAANAPGASTETQGPRFETEGLSATQAGVTLGKGRASGTMVSEAVDAPAFNWLVPWWNADIAGAGSLSIELQAETDAGWSDWFGMGVWAGVSHSASRSADIAKVDVDTLKLTNRASRYRVKFTFSSGGSGSVTLYRCGVLSRDSGHIRPDENMDAVLECENSVPRRSQTVEDAAIKGRICSPTCVSMALESLGIRMPTAFVAEDCYDAGEKIYGNWPFNVASLWRLGARARLDFFPTFASASNELAAGRILIASIRFKEGELTGAPISKTAGHLVLLRGIGRNQKGELGVLVNDPAAGSAEEVPRFYALSEFGKAWSGVAYVVEGRR